MNGTLANKRNLVASSVGFVLLAAAASLGAQAVPVLETAATASSVNEVVLVRQNHRRSNPTIGSGSVADVIVLARQNQWQVNGAMLSGSAANRIVLVRQGLGHVSNA